MSVVKLKYRWTGHILLKEEALNAYRILVGKPLGKLCGRPRRTYGDNIKRDVTEMSCETGS
jgi:hypothetical protein